MISYITRSSVAVAAMVIAALAFAQENNRPSEDNATCAPVSKDGAAACGSGASASACVSTCTPGAAVILSDPAAHIDRATITVTPSDLGLASLDSLLEPIRARYLIPSLSVTVVRNGELIAAGAVGVRRAYEAQAANITDQYHLGSCGKAFTATVAGHLVDRDVLSWTSTLSDVFSDMNDKIRPEYRDVTLADLLSHRSGLPSGPNRDTSNAAWTAVTQSDGSPSAARAQLVSAALQIEPAVRPGEAFLYSDYGFVVAGAMMEKATGETFEALLSEYVGEPLHLTSLGEGAPGDAEDLSQPRGHVVVDGRFVPLEPGPGADMAHPAIQPAGTLHASTLDWARFAAEHLKCYRKLERLDPSEPFDASFYIDRYNQGYVNGWQIGSLETADGPETVLHHSGSCGAWGAQVWIVPDRNVALVATSNYGGSEGFAAIADALGAAYGFALEDR